MIDQSAFGKHPRQLVRDPEWFNAGPPPELLRTHFLTPRELFFTRNHATVPQVDRERYRLSVSGLVGHPLELSLDQLRSQFPVVALEATLACAGMRRDELQTVRPIPAEVPWGAEPISTGRWRGVRLRDVLKAAGVQPEAWHVAFTGLDEIERRGERFGFGGSIPFEKAMTDEVLLAFELNDRPLDPVHGFPLRALVPGYIGARSVKYLSRIAMQAEPSSNYFQAHSYRLFPPHITAESVGTAEGVPMSDIPLNAVIWQPLQEEAVRPGSIRVRGWALANRGRTVDRVEVSADGGDTWQLAQLSAAPNPWTWCWWEAALVLPSGEHVITARAWDSMGETQPSHPEHLWNFKGYGNNCWHRVAVKVGT